MPRTMQLVTFSLCVASAVALPTAPPTSVPKTVTAPRIPSASFLTALATQPALGNETMSVLMATMMANHEARPAGRHLQADPKSDAELMKSAVEAAKLTIGTIKDAVTGFLNQVAEVDKEIKDLNPTGIDQQMMVNFTTSAATASIHLSHVTTDAHNIYKSMLDLTGVTIQTLQMGMKAGASDATKVSAVNGAMTLFAASAQSSAKQLELLQKKVGRIQEEYAYVKAASHSMATTLRDHLSGKDNWLKQKDKLLREEAYGGCGGLCVLTAGLGCACYAAAIPIVESKIAAMKSDMESATNQVNLLAGHFDDLTKLAADMQVKAKEQYDTMGSIATELHSAATVVKALPSPDFWSIVLPKLEELKTDLQKAYDAGQPSAAAPPSPSPAPQ